MPRARLIKPGFFTNEDLPDVEPFARLLFVGLWCLADREGRLEDRPRRIKAELFAHDEGLDVQGLLCQLADKGFIRRYQVDGAGYIQIANFAKHQHPHHNEPASTLPPPPDETGRRTEIVRVAADNGRSASDAVGRAPAVTSSGNQKRNTKAKAETKAVPPPETVNGGGGADFDGLRMTLLARGYENTIGTISPAIAEELRDWSDRVPNSENGHEWIHYAYREAAMSNARSWRYVRSVLERGEAEGWPPPGAEPAPATRDLEAEKLEQRYLAGKRRQAYQEEG